MTDGVPDLDDDQRRVVEAYRGMQQGLAVLASVPGAGKSTVVSKAAAVDLLDRAAAGDRCPHERVLIASFSRADAADLVPDIVAWINALFERGDAPAALDRGDVDRLLTQVREAPRIGTVDSVLRGVCADIVTEMGFDGMPTVGNEALVEQLHQDAFDAVRADEAGARRIDRVREAYEDAPAASSVSTVLREAFTIARRRALTPAAFTDQLKTAITANYRGGSVSSLEDVLEAVSAYRDESTAAAIRATVSDAEATALVEADEALREDWVALAETVGELLDQYAAAYDERSRQRGVITHTDCARLVEAYFSDPAYASPRRERLKQRYRSVIESVIIDEAQDVSQLQHDALTHLVGDKVRILLAGDQDQCIYQWRDATPALFTAALDDGEYFGRTWTPHETERAGRNYRSRPALVRLANAAAERGLGHAARGGLGAVATESPSMTAARSATDEPSIHVSTFKPRGAPGSDKWVAPDQGRGEAAALARSIASGLTTGRVPSTDADAGITVLFPRRRHMEAYAAAFEARGVTVADASTHLFDAPAVRAVIDVLEWLIDPSDAGGTRTLLEESALAAPAEHHADAGDGLSALPATVRDANGGLRESAIDTVDEPFARVLSGLVRLRDDRRLRHAEPASIVVREIIDRLGLDADPLGIDPATDDPQRVATLDAFVDLVEEWEGDDRYGLSRLHQLLTPFVETPSRGPTQPVVDPEAVDVVFRTVHDAKGDQDDVVVLADTACSKLSWVTGRQTLVASDDGVALAPPASVGDTDPSVLPEVEGGLYEPAPTAAHARASGGHGLRWDADYWVTAASEPATLRGPPVRRAAAAATRAEWWRTLHVALTRAQEHLVIPLPRTQHYLSRRDHWAQVLSDVLGADVLTDRGTHTVALPGGDGASHSTQVAVDHGQLDPSVTPTESQTVAPPQRPQQATPATDILGDAWQLRFLRPSLHGPLVDDPAATLVPILREQTAPIETDSAAPDVALPFDAVGSEQVGDLVHRLVARLVRADLAADEVDGPVAREIAASVLKHVAAGDDEQAKLYRFLTTEVLPDLAGSALWSRVERAATVYVEEPLEAVTRVDGVDVEVQGAADLVIVTPDGTHHVEELKVRLSSSPPPTDTLRRYRLQAQVYAWTLTQQVDDSVRVEARVTTVGATTETYTGQLAPAAGLHELIRLRE
jgi:ATP-dependent helicase/nuclease subunit A